MGGSVDEGDGEKKESNVCYCESNLYYESTFLHKRHNIKLDNK